jgi:hypothetical protein
MKTMPDDAMPTPDVSGLSAAEMAAVVAGLQQQLAAKEAALSEQEAQLHSQAFVIEQRDKDLQQHNHHILRCHNRIQLLEELLRLKTLQKFAASSEKSINQFLLFDEAELEAEIDALRDQLPDDVEEEDAPRASRKRRQRGFSDQLLRERIELTLSDEEKAGASKTFFTKVKEELQFIPAQLKVLEYWQEKAVFEQDGEERILAATRPVHPLGKCIATTSLLLHHHFQVCRWPAAVSSGEDAGPARARRQPYQHGELDHPSGRRAQTADPPHARGAERQRLPPSR